MDIQKCRYLIALLKGIREEPTFGAAHSRLKISKIKGIDEIKLSSKSNNSSKATTCVDFD